MKIYKLYTHQKTYNDADLLINNKEHPDVKINDIVEVYHKDGEENTRLLLQVKKFKDLKNRNAISIESGVAAQFKLRPFTDVIMHVINVADVVLDSMEIIFKDQYMGRSEMWRLKKHLLKNCVYVNKKIEYNDVQMRCQVYELWCQGERVTCGVIGEDTKIIFRSSTSMVYLFVQMSSEMWDYDIHGDLYFEKAVNGFLTELFNKWKKFTCNHEVTIVLFSRTFYEARTLDEFPVHMRDCLQMDYKGRFYEDFYRVAVQNERNDDWCTVLGQLRKLFSTYLSVVLNYHAKDNIAIPTAYNSTASQGNFLEVLNISLNKFEKHYLDRTFDRTGQLSVVITPGVGVFEVDRELTNITKQRVIDNGVGSDLVCVGEQPLHAVPLLKFHNKDTALTSVDDYSLPHWINLSFYSTNKKIAYSNFIPRIKIPLTIANSLFGNSIGGDKNVLHCSRSYIHNSFFDYEAYDDQIFQPLPAHGTCTLQRIVKAKKTSVPCLETSDNCNDWDNYISANLTNLRRKLSDPNIHHGTGITGIMSKMAATTTSSEYLAFEKNARRSIVSIVPIVRPGRALINPFDPTHVTVKLTSNRRRWTHIFPKGPTGVLIQQHHYQAVPIKSHNGGLCANGYEDYDHISVSSINTKSSLSYDSDCATTKDEKKCCNYRRSNTIVNETITPTKSYLWGATGEQEWTPAITTDKVENYIRKNLNPIFEIKSTSPTPTAGEYNVEIYGTAKIIIGVDWKSLTIPACLPITTDYFPDKRSLHNDYVVSDYTLLPDDVNLDCGSNPIAYRRQWSTEEVFMEIVSQRLAQGFQLIILEDKSMTGKSSSSTFMTCEKNVGRSPSIFNIRATQEDTKEYTLSIGRIFHKISLNGSVIKITGYRPRHPFPPINVEYRYRFHAPQHENYNISGVNFMTEKLENFNWNYMDHYICTRGNMDYPLLENLKYWRYRMYLLPKDNKAMNKILDVGSQYCDIFTDITIDLFKQQIDDFMRFMELHINKLKRCKPRDCPTAQSHLTRRRHSTSIISKPPSNQGFANSPFRERVGSNRLPEKRPSCTPRAAIAKMERTRLPQAGDIPTAGSMIGEIGGRDECFDGFTNESKLHANASINEILEAMQHPNTGLSFISQTPSLPSHTFVSYDALIWLKNHLSDDRNPLHILEDMRQDKMICHASGDWNKSVIPGFCLYYFVQKEMNGEDTVETLNDLNAFKNEWMEIEIIVPDSFWSDTMHPDDLSIANTNSTAKHACRKLCKNKNVYHRSYLEIDVNQKNERIEWGHVKYHTTIKPGYAFEIVVEWLTPSGPIVWDLINTWMRKANQCNYQLVPIPADPMAQPFAENSDPLRAPIFIPLFTAFLEEDDNLFNECSKEKRSNHLLAFQEVILYRFGFLPCILEHGSAKPTELISTNYQYVHCSGNLFALTRCSLSEGSTSTIPDAKVDTKTYGVCTRDVTTTNTTSTTTACKLDEIGFLWAWNHMIPNKRWKSFVINNSADNTELFQLKLLKDFRDFCSNTDNRLLDFYKHSLELKQQQQNTIEIM